MPFVALHFASGASFFSGSGCLLLGLLFVTSMRRRLLPPLGRLLILIGLFLIVLSATPLPLWAYGVWGVSLLFWVVSRFAAGAAPSLGPASISNKGRGMRPMTATVTVMGCTLAAAAWEVSWQLPPRALQEAFHHGRQPDEHQQLVVIGDSLSAQDFTEGGDPWPTLLAREHRIAVVNLAFSGATARSAEKRLTPDDVADAVVIVEIGGNDLLGSTSAADFERDLDRLLGKICRQEQSANGKDKSVRPNNLTRPPLPPLAKGGSDASPLNAGPFLVAMLELPLPPLYNRFGAIQRRLAQRHGVVLIPKRYFASVLIGEQATLDGLHLSPSGHQKMAEMIWTQIERCF